MSEALIWILLTVSFGGTVSTSNFPSEKSCQEAANEVMPHYSYAGQVTQIMPGTITSAKCIGPIIQEYHK